MASDRSIRHTVAADMKATTLRMISSLASSAQLQRDNGTPLVAGSSQANALISAFTEGGKDPGPAASATILQTFQTFLEEPLTPSMHHLGAGIAADRDRHIREPFCGQQHDPGSHDPSVGVGVTARSALKFTAFLGGQDDLEWADTATGHGVPPLDERNATHTPSPQLHRITSM
jgi:hypothetical protein